jgi:hypothetical protein
MGYRMNERLFNRLKYRMTNRPSEGRKNWLTYRLIIWLDYRLNERLASNQTACNNNSHIELPLRFSIDRPTLPREAIHSSLSRVLDK